MKAIIVAKRLIRQISADRRSIALLFIAPIFVLYLLSIILTSSTSKPIIYVINPPGAFTVFTDTLAKNADVKKVDNENTAIEKLKNNQADAYIKFINNNTTPSTTLEGSDPSISGLVTNLVQKSMATGKTVSPIKPKFDYMYASKNLSMFDSFAPLFMGFFIFFFVFLLAGVSFLRERISGTLERVLATPLRRSEIVIGYFLGFGLFVSLQTIVIELFMIYGLNIEIKGNFWYVLIIDLILAGQSLALGTLLSAFARNEFQLFQFIPIVIVPQILFSGLVDLRDAPVWVTYLSKIFPLTYGADALKQVIIRGKNLSDVQCDVYILLGYTLVFLILNIIALKKYRRA